MRLADIPLPRRLQALDDLLRHGNVKTPDEAQLLLAIAVDPQHRGGRIAA